MSEDFVVKKKNKIENTAFIVDFLVGGGKPHATVAFSAPNKESAQAVATIIVATNWPNLTGFNLYKYNQEYEYEREFLVHAPAMQMAIQFGPEINKAVGAQVMKSVVPVVGTGLAGEDLTKLAEEAKKRGMNLT